MAGDAHIRVSRIDMYTVSIEFLQSEFATTNQEHIVKEILINGSIHEVVSVGFSGSFTEWTRY